MHSGDIVGVFSEFGHLAANEEYWEDIIREAEIKNTWFGAKMVHQALDAWSQQLKEEKIHQLLSSVIPVDQPKEVGLVMAGNIPLVGLHDLICVLLSGHKAKVKMSREDEVLMGKVIGWLNERLDTKIEVSNQLKNIDAVIATGSNNTSRYFEYYFRNIPHLIRKNRTSIAILDSNDDEYAFTELAKDVFLYFGLGCRNVGKIFIPEGFDIPRLLDAWQDWTFLSDHNKYSNNVLYHRAIYLMNQIPHLDTGFVLLKEDEGLFSPLGTVYYSRYKDIQEVKNYTNKESEHIQCIVTGSSEFGDVVPFGKSQFPELEDFADRINTIAFLNSLEIKRKDLA